MNRGLIEVGRLTVGGIASDRTLPRFMNRGLIEVRTNALWTSYVDALPRFMNRGLIEVTSEKARSEQRVGLPRFMNRGLIEVAAYYTASTSCAPDFPDS